MNGAHTNLDRGGPGSEDGHTTNIIKGGGGGGGHITSIFRCSNDNNNNIEPFQTYAGVGGEEGGGGKGIL